MTSFYKLVHDGNDYVVHTHIDQDDILNKIKPDDIPNKYHTGSLDVIRKFIKPNNKTMAKYLRTEMYIYDNNNPTPIVIRVIPNNNYMKDMYFMLAPTEDIDDEDFYDDEDDEWNDDDDFENDEYDFPFSPTKSVITCEVCSHELTDSNICPSCKFENNPKLSLTH